MARRQCQLGFAPDGQVSNWNYDDDLSRKGLCHMIAAHDLPLGFGADGVDDTFAGETQEEGMMQIGRAHV